MKEYDNAFEFFDRYDILISLLVGVVMWGSLLLGAPLWAGVLILFLGCVIDFIRHFDDINGPTTPSAQRESRSEHLATHSGK